MFVNDLASPRALHYKKIQTSSATYRPPRRGIRRRGGWRTASRWAYSISTRIRRTTSY